MGHFSTIIDALGIEYNRTPVIFKKKRFFSIVRLKTRSLAQITDFKQLPLPDGFAIVDRKEGYGFSSGMLTSLATTTKPRKSSGSFTSTPLRLNPGVVEESPPSYIESSRWAFSEYLRFKELPSLP